MARKKYPGGFGNPLGLSPQELAANILRLKQLPPAEKIRMLEAENTMLTGTLIDLVFSKNTSAEKARKARERKKEQRQDFMWRVADRLCRENNWPKAEYLEVEQVREVHRYLKKLYRKINPGYELPGKKTLQSDAIEIGLRPGKKRKTTTKKAKKKK